LHLTAGEIFYRKVTVIFMSRRSPSLPLAACRLALVNTVFWKAIISCVWRPVPFSLRAKALSYYRSGRRMGIHSLPTHAGVLRLLSASDFTHKLILSSSSLVKTHLSA
jgi:hypothetical protein